MIKRYDPLRRPDPDAWLAMDEGERQSLVETYHRRARVKLPNARLHAIIHAVVENQAAMGAETPVAEALERLVGEGLDRHEALHAVGSALAGYLHALLGASRTPPDAAKAAYYAEVRALTRQRWLDEYEDGSD